MSRSYLAGVNLAPPSECFFFPLPSPHRRSPFSRRASERRRILRTCTQSNSRTDESADLSDLMAKRVDGAAAKDAQGHRNRMYVRETRPGSALKCHLLALPFFSLPALSKKSSDFFHLARISAPFPCVTLKGTHKVHAVPKSPLKHHQTSKPTFIGYV